MNATEDGDEPVGEGPIDTLQLAENAGVIAGADYTKAFQQLAERQTAALNKIRELHRSINLVTCELCGDNPDDGCVCEGQPGELWRRVCEECGQDEDEEWTPYPCATVRAIDEAGS